MIRILAVLLLCVCGVVHVRAAATADPCVTEKGVSLYTGWQAIPEPWDFSLTSQYPLGFKTGAIGEDNSPPLCISVPNTQAKKVQILIETVPMDARICVKDTSNVVSTNNPGAVQSCGSGRVHACFPSDTGPGTMNLVFFCDTGCATGPVTFWYRIQVSQVTWENDLGPQDGPMDNLEMWCMKMDTLNSTAYPRDLLKSEPLTRPQTVTEGSGNAVGPMSSALLAFVMIVAVAIGRWFH